MNGKATWTSVSQISFSPRTNRSPGGRGFLSDGTAGPELQRDDGAAVFEKEEIFGQKIHPGEDGFQYPEAEHFSQNSAPQTIGRELKFARGAS